MARKKPLPNYPREYSFLVERANEKTVVVVCSSHEQAVNLRNDLYAFRQVLYEAGAEHKELSDAAQNCRFLITDATLTVEPIRRDYHGTQSK